MEQKLEENISEQKFHVFISYAHVDNMPLLKGKEGWISQFHEALETLLKQKMKDATVWRDERMERNAIFDEEIFQKLLQSLTLVSVVTPSYIESIYCLKELKKFCENIPVVGTKSRVFKVVKTRVELNQMPEIFRQINGYDFFKIDEQSKIPREFMPDFGKDWEQQFLLKISDLAYEIAELLRLIRKEEARKAANSLETEIQTSTLLSSNKATVYLAETSGNFQKERDNIRRDLLERGYDVLPPGDVVPPQTTEKYKTFVRENLEKCNLSVHLIGENYGERPEDGEQSYIHLQSIVAAERDQHRNFTRIVWIPKDVNINQPLHQDFVKEIWTSTENGVEVLEKPLEELKTNILDALNRAAKPAPQLKLITAKPSVLVLYDKTDVESAVSVEKHIKERGFSLWSAAKYLSGEPSMLIEAQNNYLRNCDAVLIYWNASPDFWARIMLQRLQKILGDGRDEVFLGEGVFVDGNNTADDIADDTEADFVSNFEELDTFLETIKTAFQAKLDKRGQK